MNRPDAESDFFAYGNKGQFIYISPAANTVIVRFGEKYGIEGWKYIENLLDIKCENGVNNGSDESMIFGMRLEMRRPGNMRKH